MAAKGARVHIYGDWDGSGVKRAQRDLSTFQQQATGFSGAIGKSFLGMGAAIGGAFAIGSVISSVTDYLRDAAQAAIEDEKSMVSLAKAMENVNQSFANASTEQFVSELAMATGVADDSLRPALSRLITATGDAAQAQDLLKTALDLSAAGYGTVETAATALSKAASGNVAVLRRLGIPLDQNIVKTKDFGAALEVLNDRFGGQAAAAAETYGGQLARLQVAAGEAQETIGYALLDAIDDVAKALGGTGGLTESILGAGQYVADIVTGIGEVTVGVIDLVNAVNEINPLPEMLGLDESAMTAQMLESFLVGPLILGLKKIGEAAREAEEANAAATSAMFGPLYRLRDLARETYGAQEQAAQDAEEAIKELRDEVNALKSALSTNQSVDDFAAGLRDLDEKLEGNKRTFKGMSDSALENRETLRTAFSDAAGVVQGFVEEGRISEAEFAGVFAGTGKKIVDDLVAQGFKRKDIKAFLQREGLWTPELAAIFSKENNAVPLGEAETLGYNLGRGVGTGIASATPKVKNTFAAMMGEAIKAAKNSAKIKSPSEVTRDEIGVPLVEGIIIGLDSKKDEVKAKATETAQAFIDAAKGIVDGWDVELDRLKGVYDQALNDFTAFKDGITADIFGRLDLDSAITEAEKTGTGIVDALTKQASGIGTFAQNMIDLTKTNLSQAAWQAVASLSAERGTELSTQMLGAQGQTIIDGVNKIYGDVDAMATAVGLLAAQKWYGEGVAQAQATYDGFKANFGEGGPARKALENLMDRLAKSLDRTATITVRTVYEAAGIDGRRAAGGPVTAGKAYLVGERGPEVLVMGSQSGQIIPNGDLPMATGVRGGDGASMSAPVVINVSAGMGTDGAEVGRQVVEALKAYSRRNGPLPLAVA